jgi:hypothetical protein
MRLAQRARRLAWSRLAWGLCGLATAAALAIPATLLITTAGEPTHAKAGPRPWVPRFVPQTETFTVPEPVTSLNVQSYAGPLQVTAAPVSQVQVTETYIGTPPAVEHSVSGARLFLVSGSPPGTLPECLRSSCELSLAVTVPLGVTVSVTAAGGPVFISGTSGADVDSLGGVIATSIDGPLTVSTHRSPLQINGVTGPLSADTGGGPMWATGVSAATAVVSTDGGRAQIGFSAAPQSVTISTSGGPAELAVPGGPYALTASSNGAADIIGIATSSTASRSITVTTGGGQLVISSGQIAGAHLPLTGVGLQWLPCPASPPALICLAGKPRSINVPTGGHTRQG